MICSPWRHGAGAQAHRAVEGTALGWERPQLDNRFDGDTGSATFVMSNEALAENEKRLSSKQTWVRTDGSLAASFDYDTISYVLTNLTGRFNNATYAPVHPV